MSALRHKHCIMRKRQRRNEVNYEEKKQNRHFLCAGAAHADTRHGSRGENKAKNVSKEKDNHRRADIPFEIKRGI